MPWAAAAAVVGAAISASAAEDAEDGQYAASQMANNTQRDQFNQTRADNMPALEGRNASLQRMRELLGITDNNGAQGFGSLSGRINPGDVTSDPGYQFGMNEGMKALNNRLAARGMTNSGAGIKQGIRYANDYATTKYDNALNRIQTQDTNTFNRLASVAGYGQTGANQIGAAGQNYANNVSANQLALGNAQGAAGIAQGNALAGGLNQAAGWYSNQQSMRNNQQNVPMYQQSFTTVSD